MEPLNYKILVNHIIDSVIIEQELHNPSNYTIEEYIDKRAKALKEIQNRINALEMTLEVPK